ncbi:MAG: class A beta-lactamase-related serine hydrolase [Patescibacteria group bacterium]|nr:class A beta-lactamase-related serine hydrolase [Patescibacteria group bacterium]
MLSIIKNSIKYKNQFLLIILFIIFFCLGFLVSSYLNKKPEEITEKRYKNIDYNEFKYINPLFECNNYNYRPNKEMASTKNKIKKYVEEKIEENKISFVSVYFRDLNNGPWFGINEGADFSPASLIKVPVMMAYFYEAEKDPEILNKSITVNKNFDYSSQNIQPEVKLEMNKSYSIEELIERMIIYSDNYAYDLLLENIDNKKIFEVYANLGMFKIAYDTYDSAGDIINVKEYSSFFRVLFNASYINKYYSQKALSILTKSSMKNGIMAGIPNSIDLAHKYGERTYSGKRDTQFHDCGIIYYPNHPYLLCIMTKNSGRNLNNSFSIVKNISKMIFEYVSLNSEQ